MIAAPALVCLGNLTIDDVVLPTGAHHPGCLGGDALYAGYAARLFEPRTEIVAPIGCDWSEAGHEALLRAGFSMDGLRQSDRPTLHNRVVYSDAERRDWTLFSPEADFETLSPRPDDIPDAFHGADAMLILAMTLAAQEALVTSLSARGALIALDPQEDYILGNEARFEAMVAGCDIFLPSAEEVRQVLGHSDWSRAARELSALGPRQVVIKLGAEGALCLDGEGEEEAVPAYPCAAVDTTGGGDAFCGALMARLVRGATLVEAARAGAVAASFAIADFGLAGIAAVTPSEAQSRLSLWGRV